MKAVLMSIQPKWCELIASGKKTVEVRKTKPKLETPFKVYIYQTLKPVSVMFHGTGRHISEYDKTLCYNKRSGKVIGEFVCDSMTSLKADNMIQAYYNNTKNTCLTDEEIKQYANNGKLYYWHISDLIIYDEPKELSEFYTIDNEAVQKCDHRVQSYFDGYCNSGCLKCGFYCSKKDDWCDKCKTKPITRPPQSWCYVEEVGE